MARSAAWVAFALLGAAALLPTPALAGWKQVQVGVSVPPRLETEPGAPTLVALFRGSGIENVDVGLEISRFLKREIGTTALSVLDVPPPPIPEQRPEKMAANDPFWRRLGEDFKADLIVAGLADYRVEDRSGFVSEDVVSPVTGQTVRRTRYAERRGFVLRITIFFFKGDNGALLHSDVWTESRILEGTEAEDLQQLYDLLDAMKDDLRSTLLPTTAREPRYIWSD